ncbi:MAG TPA: HNH endonuclease [bacterium]|nr:HNH endonuclease [bacterium]HNT67408.1 HNH endonuclease [bacterium]
MRNKKNIKKELISQYGAECAICGEIDVPLELHNLIPHTFNDYPPSENFLLVCSNCHKYLDLNRPKEIEFVEYLASLIQKNPNYKNVFTKMKIIGKQPFQVDISAELILEDNEFALILIECKNYTAITKNRLHQAIKQIDYYRQTFDAGNYVLALPARLSQSDKSLVSESKIVAWDIDFISENFEEEIKKTPHPYFQNLFKSIKRQSDSTPEFRLLSHLKTINAGKKEWPKYQKIIGIILERLFCPPLSTPINESKDEQGINRRDFILPNYTETGFWSFLRNQYRAEYIVVDAKNYKGKIKKDQALQVANYLKQSGAGLVGIIICRNGADTNCLQVIREQWISQKKLIIVLDDNDIESMLLAASSGGIPTEVIKQKIEEFRLSI